MLSFSELAFCTRQEIDWVLGIKNGPAKLLDDKIVPIAFSRSFIGFQTDCQRVLAGASLVPAEEKRLIRNELLQRVAHHDE